MNQLVPTFTGTLAGESQPLVNARDLYDYVSRETKFEDWIVRKIEQYGFAQGIDYLDILTKKTGANWFGGERKITEYHLSLDMAKELAMVENTEQGRKARRYFIQMEKVARQEIPAFLRRGELPRPGQVEALQAVRLKATLLAAKPQWQKLARYHALKLSQGEIATLLGLKPGTVRDKLRELAACGLVDYRTNAALAAAGRRGLQVIQAKQAARQQGGAL